MIRSKLLMVVLDAAEPTRIEALVRAGRMPNLAALLSAGSYRRVASTADWWVASPWPSFYTGRPPSQHGFYYYLWWDPETLRSSRPGPDRFQAAPFWRTCLPAGARSIVIDGSQMHVPQAGDDIEISGWRTHDILSEPWIYPRRLQHELQRRGWGPAPLIEAYRLLDEPTLRRTLADLREATASTRDLACLLLARESWDFAVVSLTAPHMAGHQLWAPTSLAPQAGAAAHALLATALDEVYIDCDRALGDILASGHKAQNLIVCSLHGMEHNRNRGVMLPQMLDITFGNQHSALHGDAGLAGRLRQWLPEELRHAIKSRVPMQLQDYLTGYWRTGGYDWGATRAFSFVPDLQGYIRINQRGREIHGIVSPGEETAQLKRLLRDALLQFVDADDGEPVVSDVKFIEEFAPAERLRHFLPDIVVNWAASPAAKHSRIRGPGGSEIGWPAPGRNSDGRSGNHSDRAFLVASGPAFETGAADSWSSILDFADRISALLAS
jgi:predicted AlkP superfamily phosphohydrolase/phosphomutase